jgi:hypothetical protein
LGIKVAIDVMKGITNALNSVRLRLALTNARRNAVMQKEATTVGIDILAQGDVLTHSVQGLASLICNTCMMSISVEMRNAFISASSVTGFVCSITICMRT